MLIKYIYYYLMLSLTTMEKQNIAIKRELRKRLEVQGYIGYSDVELNDHKFGIRHAYYLCGSLVLLGLILTNIYILIVAMAIAFLGSVLQNHPLDYLYNAVTRHLFNKPKMIRRPNQGRFACGIATVMIGGTIYLFYAGLNIWGYVSGGSLLVVATLVATTDICIPSMIYNSLFLRKKESMQGSFASTENN